MFPHICITSQRYKELLSQKGEAVASSRESVRAADCLGPATEPTADCPDENPHSDDTGSGTDVNSMQPIITLTRLRENQEQEEQAESDPTSQDFTAISVTSTGSTDQDLLCKEEETTSQAPGVQERPAELPAGSRGEPEPGAAAEDANEEGEKEAPAVPGKNSDTGKAKTTPKRRSGRATNRR